MAEFKNAILTNEAKKVITQLSSGALTKLTFTKIVTTEKNYASLDISEIEKLKSLENIKQEILVDEINTINESTMLVNGSLGNASLTNGYYINTIGLYARVNEEEILYSVSVAIKSDYMPAFNNTSPSVIDISLITSISNSKSTNITIDDIAHVSVRQFEEFKSNIDAQLNDNTKQLTENTNRIESIAAEGIDKDSANAIVKEAVEEATKEGIPDRSISTIKTDFDYNKYYKNVAFYKNSEFLNPTITTTSYATAMNNLTPFTSLEQGKYLLYLDVQLNVENLPNGRIVPYVFKGNVVTMIDVLDEKASIPRIPSIKNFRNIISYGIVDVPETSEGFRIGFIMTELTTSVTNKYNVKVNKLYAIKMTEIDEDLIEIINNTDNLQTQVKCNYYEVSKNTQDIKEIKAQLLDEINEIDCFGDSMTGSTDGWVKALNDVYKINAINRGIGGQTGGQIACRQGGVELLVDPFTIPSSAGIRTPITCNYKLYAQQSGYEGINPCYIKGVKGILRNATNTTDGFTFQRSEDGEVINITRPTSIITDNMLNRRKNKMIIWLGTNGDYSTSSREADKLIEIIDSMISYNGSYEYIVIGLTTNVAGIPTINEKLKSKYGRRFLDLRKYLIQYGLEDLNIQPTQDDLDKIAHNNVPLSLMSDNTHLTSNCQKTIVAKLIYDKLNDLNMV